MYWYLKQHKIIIAYEFLATFKKFCTLEQWLKLVDDLKPHMDKHSLKLIVVIDDLHVFPV